MKLPLLAVLVLLPSPLFAASQAVELKFKVGEQTFVKKLSMADNGMVNFVGSVDSTDGEARRKIIFNGTAGKLSDDGFVSVECQLEIQSGSQSETFQSQSAVQLRPGDSLAVAQCGQYSARLTVPGKKNAAPNHKNFRVTAEIAGGDGKAKCSQVSSIGSQSNLVSSLTLGEARKHFILNGVLTDDKGGYAIQHQLELSSAGGGKGGLQQQGSLALTPGKSVPAASGGGAKIGLRLDPAS